MVIQALYSFLLCLVGHTSGPPATMDTGGVGHGNPGARAPGACMGTGPAVCQLGWCWATAWRPWSGKKLEQVMDEAHVIQ